MAGLMSGTSVNAVDCAICSISGHGIPAPGNPGAKVELLGFTSVPFPAALRARVTDQAQLNARAIAELNQEVGELFGLACLKALKSAGLKTSALDLIGSHGQTIYHHSGIKGHRVATLQIGDGDIIAERLGVPVVSDFRPRDIACGGEGAPLTPYADAVLFARHYAKVGIINIGGISNLTLLNKDKRLIVGFDLGPGNAPLDRLTRIVSKGRAAFDSDGKLARGAKIDLNLLKSLIRADKFIKRKPPKSTGTEMYGDLFVQRAIKEYGRANKDLLATMTAFVGYAIAYGISHHIKRSQLPDIVYVAGGGCRNQFLMELLEGLLDPLVVAVSDDFGIPAEAREALSFAILANDLVCGEQTSIKTVTGARHDARLGKISLGA